MDLANHVPEGAPRDLYLKEMKRVATTFNEHAQQIYTIFTQISFKQILECKDTYITMMFMQSRDAWLFKLDDPDFQKFYREEVVPIKDQLKESLDQEVIALIDSRLSLNAQ